MRAITVAMLLPKLRIPDKPLPEEPPSTFREPITKFNSGSVLNDAIIEIKTVSSCCKSPSITATYGAALDNIPSMHAPESPRRPIL